MIDASLLPPLYDLLTVAREVTVGAASASLHKTPSAVSQQIHRLEHAFGVALTEKAGRGVKLSAVGQEVLGPLTRLFDEAEAVYSLLGRLSGLALTTVRISLSDYLGRGLLAPVMRDLAAAGAPLRFEITTAHSSQSVGLLEKGAVDIAIISSTGLHHGLEERLLFEQEMLWVGPRHGAKSVTEALESEPLLRLAPGSVGRQILDRYLHEHGARPVSTIDVPSVSLLLSYVAAGVGFGLAPELALGKAERTACRVFASGLAPVPVKLLLRSNYDSRPELEDFVEKIATRASALP